MGFVELSCKIRTQFSWRDKELIQLQWRLLPTREMIFQRCFIKSVILCRLIWVFVFFLGMFFMFKIWVRVFWSVWSFVFYIFYVRVTESREVGYGTITVRITGGQSVKIETTGRHIELEANHRWTKCNYPFLLLSQIISLSSSFMVKPKQVQRIIKIFICKAIVIM